MEMIVDSLRRLLESYTEPCVGDCDHSQCPLLRELHALQIKATLEQDFGRDGLALIFGYDRHNQAQRCQCVGPEMWELWELDFETLDRYEDD